MNQQFYPLLPIIIPPLAGFAFLFIFSHNLKGKIYAAYGACAAVFLSFVFSLPAFYKIASAPEISLKQDIFPWFNILGSQINFSLTMDSLSAVMVLIVSGVSFLIHIYSLGYMGHDKEFVRFFSYLNLFVFFMLILVLASNPIVMFVGWEGVGLCSYLLIGFWYENLDNSRAGKKAFITNRVGDAFFIIGLILLISALSSFEGFSLDFSWLKENLVSSLSQIPGGTYILALSAIFMFLGATGKSAQFPLYIWLPDAMAGPTPVSALIHAATMVTAGVYMVSRMFFLYQAAPISLEIIIYTASLTSVLAAIIACLQNDIKKILAYSTISQLGYMFLGIGAGVYQGAFFHLATHAFFKALLFLAAGSVIHSLGGVQDIFKMGGLKDKIKYTFLLTAAGWLAISGIPPLSGFYSKDFIIETVWLSGHKTIWFLSVLTAGLTAYYMTRMFKIVFISKPKSENHPHESPYSMLWPMAILAVLSVFSGLFAKDFFAFLGLHETHFEIPFAAAKAPLLSALIGIAAGFYFTKENISAYFEALLPSVKKIVSNKFYLDEIYDFLIVRPLAFASDKFVFSIIDRTIIDKTAVEGSAAFFYKLGYYFRNIQNGNLSFYALILVLTAAFTLLYAAGTVL
ncbi:MAG: NADH-quinone oxidoreductase subunit L [Elusimicrobiota bacterium]